jgi:hypothetical protein
MPDRIREVRALWGTTFNTAYVAASAAGWHPDVAHKLAVSGIDLSKLVGKGLESKVIQSTFYGAPANKPASMESDLPLSMYLGRGSATTAAPLEATILGMVFGGLDSPAAKTDLAETGSTSSVIVATAHGRPVGTAVLVGTRGDGRGNGEVRRIISATANNYTVDMQFAGAPANGDAIVHSHTVYLDPTATQKYIDLLILGWHAEDQIQTIGCMGSPTIKGVKEGEIPEFELALKVPSWQEVPSADRDQLEPVHAPEGDGDCLPTKDAGGCFFGDWDVAGAVARAAIESADWTINPGITFEPRANRNFENGIGGWKQVLARPKAELTCYIDLDYGLHADFTGGVAKQLMYQFGCIAQDCVAISFPKCYLDSKPTRTKINSIAALKLDLHGEVPTVANPVVYLESSPIAIHWF